MPEDEQGKYFMSDENIPKRYHYKVINWVKETEHPRRRKRIKDEDLPHVDFMVVEVKSDEKPTSVGYTTIYGPFEGWDWIEGILEYDYGTEGSLQVETTAA